jgi:plastocyanin
MPPIRSRAILLAAVLAAAAGVAVVVGGGSNTGVAQEGTPAAPPLPIDTSLRLVEASGSDVVYANCTVCHTLAPILAHEGLSAEQWADQVTKMREVNGAEFDDATAKRIIAYLSANYSAPPPSIQDELLAPARRLMAAAEATPSLSVSADETAFVVAVAEGTCAAPGSAVWDLGQTAPWGGANPIVPTPGGPVLVADGASQGKLDRFVLSGQPRAMTVRLGSAADAPLVACGDIADNVQDLKAVVVVSPVENSGIGGLATLTQHSTGFAGLGGEVVEAELLLVRGALGAAAALPPAPTPAPTAAPVAALPAVGDCADGSRGDCLPIGMRDIFFSPNMLAAPAGGETGITVVNQGAIVHNFSIDDHGNSGLTNLGVSVTLQPGDKQDVSVNAPAGDYYFYCDIPGHEAAGMRGYLSIAADGPLSATEASQTPPMR